MVLNQPGCLSAVVLCSVHESLFGLELYSVEEFIVDSLFYSCGDIFVTGIAFNGEDEAEASRLLYMVRKSEVGWLCWLVLYFEFGYGV